MADGLDARDWLAEGARSGPDSSDCKRESRRAGRCVQDERRGLMRRDVGSSRPLSAGDLPTKLQGLGAHRCSLTALHLGPRLCHWRLPTAAPYCTLPSRPHQPEGSFVIPCMQIHPSAGAFAGPYRLVLEQGLRLGLPQPAVGHLLSTSVQGKPRHRVLGRP